jgi:hypothetical protein
MPERIRRSRAKGWRLPENAVCVDRSTPWGNPFVVGRDGTRAECVEMYRHLMAGRFVLTSQASMSDQRRVNRYVADHVSELRGRDLACWCGPGPCHADVLLEIAAQADREAADA